MIADSSDGLELFGGAAISDLGDVAFRANRTGTGAEGIFYGNGAGGLTTVRSADGVIGGGTQLLASFGMPKNQR